MLEIQTTPNYHNMFDYMAAKISTVAISCPLYRARWDYLHPDTIFVKGWEDMCADWMELKIGAHCVTTEFAHMPDMSTFRPDFALDPRDKGNFGLVLEDVTTTIDDSAENENKAFVIQFSAESTAGGKYIREYGGNGKYYSNDMPAGKYTYTVSFYSDHIELNASYDFCGEFSVTRAVYACTSEDKGTFFDADVIMNPNPRPHGGQFTSLRTTMISGSNSDRWFCPSPFCFPIRVADGSWMSVSVAPTVEELDFTGFMTEPRENGSTRFTLDYTSPHKAVNTFKFVPLVFRFGAADPYKALEAYADGLVTMGKVPPLKREPADWWKGVMLCGWGEQCAKIPVVRDHCSQPVYQNLLDTFDEEGIDWDILTIDDFWGIERGIWRVDETSWPDMRKFIDTQHNRGRHVLLWVCPYTDGLPDDELYIVGEQKLLDPANPKYLRRLEENLRHMLSDEEGCLNADGMKLDFTGGCPMYGVEHCTTPLHGMRYLYEFFKVIHDIAKKIKPDCLLDFQLANPHFAAFHDMVRLNDCKVTMGMALSTYTNRAYIGQSATFGALIDTDHPDSIEYLSNSYKFGNISLYLSADQVKTDKELTALVRKIIHEHHHKN